MWAEFGASSFLPDAVDLIPLSFFSGVGGDDICVRVASAHDVAACVTHIGGDIEKKSLPFYFTEFYGGFFWEGAGAGQLSLSIVFVSHPP